MTRLEGLSDAELVQRCRTDDPAAWNELVERYSRYVYAIAVRGFRLSDEDAEDVFQDVFTRAFLRLETLRDDSAFRPSDLLIGEIRQAVGALDLHRIPKAGHWSAYENAAEVNRLMLEFFSS